MTLGLLGDKPEPGPGALFRIFRFFTLVGGVSVLLFAGVLDLTWPQQAVLGVVTLLLAMWMDRGSSSYLATLTLIFVSICATFRYGFWRVSMTVHYFHQPFHGAVGRKDWMQGICIVALLLAEGYAAVTLLLGYMQTLWPLRRMPVALPDDLCEWPSVDLLIPTLNEPLSLVRYTVLAAINLDWPAERLNIYLLDDGRREEFRSFAEEVGVGYIAREGNEHAKAGNLNFALQQTSSPYVAIFDCDHVPTRSFLQMTMGWFLRDEQLGMLQTPQHLYSPDPFDRNLEQFRTIPNEGELFYGIVQDGNDFWNSTMFCGSCAVLRRSALDEIGGIAQETLTEDVHTSLRMQRSGWNTAYINIPQAAGLATESLDGHVRQRIRWARGMIQILRIENPLFARGLTLAQRLCYFHAMGHFLYALPRLIFLAAPLAYLLLGRTILPGSWAAILAFALPHLLLSKVANSRIQGQHRHSFWNEIYETILAPYLLLPTLGAFFMPGSRKFDVTPKGSVVTRSYFDGKTAIPFLGMMALQLAGLAFGASGLLHLSWRPLPWPQHDGGTGTVVLNMVWAFFNLVILAVCTSVAWESHQRRSTVRLTMAVPVDVMFSEGTLQEGLTADISNSGVALRIDESLAVRAGEQVQLIFPVLDGEAALPATVIDVSYGVMRAQFDPLSLQEQEALTMVLYCRADTWLGWRESRESDRPLKSMVRLLLLAIRGFWQTFTVAWEVALPGNARFAASAAQMLLLAGVFLGLTAAAAQFRSSKLNALKIRSVNQAVAVQASPQRATTTIAQKSTQTVVPGKAEGDHNEKKVDGDVDTPDDLSQLPQPFFDTEGKRGASLPIVFLSEPSHQGLKAAGIVASWFGMQAKNVPLQFPVVFGSIPPGNAVVIVENAGDLSPDWNIEAGAGPIVSLRTNPEDGSSKLLILSGGNGEEAVRAAAGMALERGALRGDQARFGDFHLPEAQRTEDPRWAALPDLRLFAQTGFPFTRKADLSETAVVLPDAVTPESIEVYLALMGRFGAQTGHPGVNVTVTNSDGLKADGTKDLIVVEIGQDQAAMGRLNPDLPVKVDSEGLHPRDAEGFFSRVRHGWWRLGIWESADTGRLEVSGQPPDGMIEGAESPVGSSRSVVVLALRDRTATEKFLAAFLGRSQSGQIAKSVSLLRGERFVSYRAGNEVYHVGALSPRLKMRLAIEEFPWLMVVLTFAAAFLMAIVVRVTLRKMARERLLVTA